MTKHQAPGEFSMHYYQPTPFHYAVAVTKTISIWGSSSPCMVRMNLYFASWLWNFLMTKTLRSFIWWSARLNLAATSFTVFHLMISNVWPPNLTCRGFSLSLWLTVFYLLNIESYNYIPGLGGSCCWYQILFVCDVAGAQNRPFVTLVVKFNSVCKCKHKFRMEFLRGERLWNFPTRISVICTIHKFHCMAMSYVSTR